MSPHLVAQSVPGFRTSGRSPADVDLAVIAVRAEEVASVARACAEKEVVALVVLSSGFAEVGPEGLAR